MLSLIMFQISIQNLFILLRTSSKHTPNSAIGQTQLGVLTNGAVTQLLIDHVYLNHLAIRITDKLILTNLQHLKLYGFLGYFFCPITKHNACPHPPTIQPINGRLS